MGYRVFYRFIGVYFGIYIMFFCIHFFLNYSDCQNRGNWVKLKTIEQNKNTSI